MSLGNASVELQRYVGNIPSSSRLGVLDALSPNSSAGLDSGGVWTRDPLAFLALIGADIEGRREFVRLSGLPSSSLSPLFAPERVRVGVKEGRD